MNTIPQIFNQEKVKIHRERAARICDGHDFLLNEVAERMLERLDDMKGGYESVLNIGCASGELNRNLKARAKADFVVNQDLSLAMCRKTDCAVVADEEKLPYAQSSFDLVASNLKIHLVNDLPGALVQISRLLKKDGVFIATMYGVETLKELKQVFMEVESAHFGGVSPRVAPFTEVKTMGALLQRCGFSQPVADTDVIKVSYDNLLELLHDIRAMGESSALFKSGKPLTRQMLAMADSLYKQKFPDGEGGIIATFDIINVTGLAAVGN